MNWNIYLSIIALIGLVSAEKRDKSLNEFLTLLYSNDVNSFKLNQDYLINFQGKMSRRFSKTDVSKHPLFMYVNENLLQSRPTIAAFIKLLDNYNSQVGIKESVTPEEIQEQNDFIKEILKTKVMMMTHKFLVQRSKFSGDIEAFGEKLKELWFSGYSRKASNDSSAFEHVFVGEIRGNKILGFHNWIQFYLQEKNQNANYFGWKIKKCNDEFLIFTFNKDGKYFKPTNSLFLGRSPEFEMAVYTIAFLLNPQQNMKVRLNNCQIRIKCFPIKNKQIGTCYFKI